MSNMGNELQAMRVRFILVLPSLQDNTSKYAHTHAQMHAENNKEKQAESINKLPVTWL